MTYNNKMVSKDSETPQRQNAVTIGLLGSSGRLGRALCRHAETLNVRVIGSSRSTPLKDTPDVFIPGLNALEQESVTAIINQMVDNGAQVIVNTVGNNDTDNRELERGDLTGDMYRTNVLSAKYAAGAALQSDLPYIQLSSEYVFDGRKPPGQTYTEDDIPNRVIEGENAGPTWYGITKALSELEACVANPNTVVVRLCQLQFANGGLYSATLRGLAKGNHFTRASDQVISTMVDVDEIGALVNIARALSRGTLNSNLYHVAPPDAYTSYETCMMLVEEFGIQDLARQHITPATLEEIVASGEQSVVRPKNAIMDATRYTREFRSIGTIREQIHKYRELYGSQFVFNKLLK